MNGRASPLLLASALAAGTLPGASGAAQDAAGGHERARSLVEAAAERYAPVASLCADFVQHRTVPLLGLERTGRGRLCQEGSSRFAMRFTDPEGDAVVVDGRATWLYWPSNDPKQVLKLPLEEVPGGFDLHREFLSEPARKYRMSYEGVEPVAGHRAHRIHLVPRAPASYQAALVWIDEGTPLLRQVRIEEENGSLRTVTLTEVDLGADPPPGWFEFIPPAGVRIVSP